jgi:hypothetical protein
MASETRLEFLFLVLTAATTKGAKSSAHLPSIHLSVQKKILVPFPTENWVRL